METLQYFTAQAVADLWDNVSPNLDQYYTAEIQPFHAAIDDVRSSRYRNPNFDGLGRATSGLNYSDDADSLIVYRELEELTPHQASDQRLWVYLCHCVCPNYVSQRWLKDRPSDNLTAIGKVRAHFFCKDNRALIRDNGLSRLWWLGKIACDVAPDDPSEFLEILLYRQDVRSSLIERPFVSRNRRLLKVIYEEMRGHWYSDHRKRLFERKIFRHWMRALNRRGGVCLLDAIPDQALSDLVRTEAMTALDTELD